MKLFIFTLFSFLLLSCTSKIQQENEQYIKFKNTGKHISIHLKINDYKKGNFYFDTGSPWLMIDSTFYKNQKMTFNRYSVSENIGVGNNPAKIIRVLDTLKFSINNNTFFSKFNQIHNMKKNIGNEIDGIVGTLSFGKTPFEVNYITNKIIFNPKLDSTYQEVAIKFDGSYMYLPMNLTFGNGTTIKGDFIIDTGSTATILTSEFANDQVTLGNKKVAYINNGGISSLHLGHSLFSSQLKINKYTLNDHQVSVSKDSFGALSKQKNYIGVIGNDILEKFDIIYNPSQSKIWMKPNKNFNKSSEDLYKSFRMIETSDTNKGWIVGNIYEESDAYKKGLRHADEVVEINNQSVKKINLEKFNRQLRPNQKLKLKIKRGNDYIEIDTYLNVFLKKND
jgi:hypothetical protein